MRQVISIPIHHHLSWVLIFIFCHLFSRSPLPRNLATKNWWTLLTFLIEASSTSSLLMFSNSPISKIFVSIVFYTFKIVLVYVLSWKGDKLNKTGQIIMCFNILFLEKWAGWKQFLNRVITRIFWISHSTRYLNFDAVFSIIIDASLSRLHTQRSLCM